MYQEQPSSVATDDVAVVPASARRRLRVRYSYPKPLVQLVNALLDYHDAKSIAALLDIPLSSIYRWRSTRGSQQAVAVDADASAASMKQLLEQCGNIGFHLPPSILLEHDGETPRAPRRPRTDERRDTASGEGILPEPADNNRRNERPSRAVRERIEAVRRLMDQEYFRDLDSRTLAKTAKMSRHHFIRTFNSWVGASPHQYLMRVRIDAAKRLLGSSSQSIDVIAAATGFRSASCLNRTFRRMEGNSVSRSFGILRRSAAARPQ